MMLGTSPFISHPPPPVAWLSYLCRKLYLTYESIISSTSYGLNNRVDWGLKLWVAAHQRGWHLKFKTIEETMGNHSTNFPKILNPQMINKRNLWQVMITYVLTRLGILKNANRKKKQKKTESELWVT